MFEIYLIEPVINVTLGCRSWGHDAMLSGGWLPALWKNLPSSSNYYVCSENGGNRFL